MKNIKPIAGKPLAYWTIEAALQCSIIDKVYVATDSSKIYECIEKIKHPKLELISRSPYTATDTASSELALLEFCKRHKCGDVFFIQATSPLLQTLDLSKAWEIYKDRKYDSLLSVVRQKRFLWREKNDGFEPVNYALNNRPRRQEFRGFLVENGAFYLSSSSNILRSACRISGKIGLYEMGEDSYFEIDELTDWIIVESLLLQRKKGTSEINNKLQKVTMIAMDVDGVLTDAGMYYTENGDELKKFNTRDGKGLEMLREHGIKTAIITSENTKMVEARAKKLKIDYLYQDVANKQEALRDLCLKAGVDIGDVLYIGDDINDLPAMQISGLSACPADAASSIKQVVNIQLNTPGGQGAVREICDIIFSLK